MADNDDKSLISWGNYQLPSFLFYYSARKSTFISPTATFNPAGALNGQGWQSAIRPSSIPKPKILILTIAIYHLKSSRAEWLALIHWFQQRQFELYFWVEHKDGTRHLMPCSSQLSAATGYYDEQLDSLSAFYQADYKCLAEQYQLPYQQIFVPSKYGIELILNALNAACRRYISNKEIYDINAFMALKPQRALSVDEEILDYEDYLNHLLLEPTLHTLIPINGAKQLLRSLLAYPKHAEHLVKQHHTLLDTYDKVFSCLAAYPLLSHETLDCLLNRLIIRKEHPWAWDYKAIEAEPRLLARVAASYYRVRKHINDISLIKFIVIYCPEHAKSLMEEKWALIQKKAWIDECFVTAYPEKSDELFSMFYSKVDNSSSLARLIKAYPNQATKLLTDFSELIKKPYDLKRLMEACTPLATKLLQQYPHLISGSYHYSIDRQVADFLMQDETRITEGRLLSLCLRYYAQEAKRLLAQYVHVIQSDDDFWSCYDQINELELKKELLNAGLYKQPEDYIKKFGFSKISGNPALAFWLFNQSDYAFHFSSPNRQDRQTIMSHCPEFLDWSLSYNYPYNYLLTHKGMRRAQIVLDRTPREKLIVYKDYLPAYERYEDWNTYPIEWTDTILYQNTTYLYLANLMHTEGLFTAIQCNQLQDLVVVEITSLPEAHHAQFDTFLRLLMDHCHYVRKVIIPAEAKHWVAGHSTHYPFWFEIDGFTNFAPPRGFTPNQLYIAQNSLAQKLSNSLEGGYFTMRAAGCLLNGHGQRMQRIRTGLIELAHDNLSQRRFIPQEYQPVRTVAYLEEGDLMALKTRIGPVNYYLFVQAVTAGEKTPLFSIDAKEQLFGILNSPEEQFLLERGIDDLFYITAEQDVNGQLK